MTNNHHHDQHPSDDPADRESLIDLPALADRLGVCERHIRRLVAERRIPYYKWGHLLRFDPADVNRWLARHRIDPAA